MSPWKVILATLVIFITGLITGAVMVNQFGAPRRDHISPTPGAASLLPGPVREEFVRRMAIELKLTPEQREKIISIVHESQERTKLLYSLIGEDVREEMRQTREAIREQLTPEQARRFEEMLRQRERRLGQMRNEKLDGSPFNRPDSMRLKPGPIRPGEKPGRLAPSDPPPTELPP